MPTLLILATALLPVVVLLAFIYKRDPNPEPLPLMAKAVGLGALMVVPIIVVELVVDEAIFWGSDPTTVVGAVLKSFCVAALPEEGFKLLALWLVIRKNPFFDEHYDGIFYAVCVSLGFAAIENIGYLFDNSDAWLQVGITRALLSVPGHYAFGILMGYYLSLYTFVDRSPRNRYFILLAPVLAHGIYDSLAFSADVMPAIGGLITLGLIYFCIKMHRHSYAYLLSLIERDKDSRQGPDYQQGSGSQPPMPDLSAFGTRV